MYDVDRSPYWYTTVLTVPGSGSSTCQDINIAKLEIPDDPAEPRCAYFIVRLYPSWGGKQDLPRKHVCRDTTREVKWTPIATDVYNGTKYRILVKPDIEVSEVVDPLFSVYH
jgi:hypothetical protein